MKRSVIAAFLFLALFVAKGQQQLSYSYDASGNRRARTVAVGGQELSGDGNQADFRFYANSQKGGISAAKMARPARSTGKEEHGLSKEEGVPTAGALPCREERAGQPAEHLLRIAAGHGPHPSRAISLPVTTNLPPSMP